MKTVCEKNKFRVLKRGIGAAAIAGLMGFAGAAQANPMTVDLNFSGGGLFPAGSKGSRITYNNGVNPSLSMGVAAGMFSGTASNGVNFDETSLYLDEGNVLAYCVDIVNRLLRKTNTYNVKEVTPDLVVDPQGVRRDFGRTLQFLGAANHVARTQFNIFEGEKNWLNPSTNWMSAAIQVGIWESLYEKDSSELDTSGGWFQATSIGNKGNQFLADSFKLMGGLKPPPAVDAKLVKWLQIDGGQDLLVDPVDVPAPAPLALLLAGLALMVRLRANQ
ncbi:hypothetical protein R0137_00290 [Congregibacter brevis]|uniref:PEP-CTERM protein-sorting domain-containing protein n=1 Tax=Congregibacter brevis TaxID=3081201 RepID=A0ABZ0IDB1_9GAMM|nr:hypothetical protein R0137_00290 [Congregibacter sp. IMCC45268]